MLHARLCFTAEPGFLFFFLRGTFFFFSFLRSRPMARQPKEKNLQKNFLMSASSERSERHARVRVTTSASIE
nr:MAG TPA: hypothetical protein [Caudoviricetes sp.]